MDNTNIPGPILSKCNPKNKLTSERQIKYFSYIGKHLYLMWWTKPEMYNAVQALSCHMTMASKLHYKPMLPTMNYCVETRNKGLYFKPPRNWDRKSKTFELVIHGQFDFDYAKNPENQRRNLKTRVFLEGCSIIFRSGTQKYVCLSV